MNWRQPIIKCGTKLLRSKIPDILSEIPSWEYASRPKLDAMVNEKLWNLLVHTWSRVPYYYNLVSEQPIGAFNQIPPLTRDMINNIPNQLLSCDRDQRGYFANSSGGSSGHPIRFFQDKEYVDCNIATKIHYKRQAGHQIGDSEARLLGDEREFFKKRKSMKYVLGFWLYGRKDFNGFNLREEDMLRFADYLKRKQPDWIEAYVDSIWEFAKYCDSHNILLPSPSGLLTTSGTLHAHIKEKLEKVFNCKIYNRYGSCELGAAACSCEKGSIHVSSWNAYIEILDDDMKPVKPGEAGHIYITTLNNKTMPLIRYKNGDMAIASDKVCGCGRSTPVIGKILGREMEAFRKKNGEVVLGMFFTQLVGPLCLKKSVRKVQFIQEDYDRVVLKIVPCDNRDIVRAEVREWQIRIKEMMGKDCKVEIDFVDDLVRLKSGKICYTMCMIK